MNKIEMDLNEFLTMRDELKILKENSNVIYFANHHGDYGYYEGKEEAINKIIEINRELKRDIAICEEEKKNACDNLQKKIDDLNIKLSNEKTYYKQLQEDFDKLKNKKKRWWQL